MMFDRLRSWWDINWFIVSTLRPPKAIWVLLSACVLVSSFVFWIGDLVDRAWVGVLLGLLGMGKEVLPLIGRWFVSPPATLVDAKGVGVVLEEIGLPKGYREAGYERVLVPGHRECEFVVRSKQVDSHVRNVDIPLTECVRRLIHVNKKLRKESANYESALRCKYRESWGEHKRFVNERKVCLGEDLMTSTATLAIYQGTYFHSFLTNELATRNVKTIAGDLLFRDLANFPKDILGARNVLHDVTHSHMANHIGVSTVGFTSDKKLFLWRQSIRAQHSDGLLVPAGSGSCDWQDWTGLRGGSTLRDVLASAMGRELLEESHFLGAQLEQSVIRTSILGFFLWLRRGGKPEFVGISTIGVHSSELEANIQEVNKPEDVLFLRPASTLVELRNSVAELLSEANLSVPLWVNLICLSEALLEDCEKWSKFLSIGD